MLNAQEIQSLKTQAYAAMWEAATEAAKHIYASRWADLETVDKAHPDGEDDSVTRIDIEAQCIYEARFLPLTMAPNGIGIVAEERGLSQACTLPGLDIFYTVDPIDGTKAYARRQSHGVSTMCALADRDCVDAAIIIDAISGDGYTYGPESPHGDVIWFNRTGEIRLLRTPTRRLAKSNVIVGRHPDTYTKRVRQLIASQSQGGLFDGIDVDHGSIGLRVARLWKNEVGALVMMPRTTFPWDDAPIIGISKRLGYVFLRVDPLTGACTEFDPPIVKTAYRVEHETIVVHESQRTELEEWLRSAAP